ncbi:Chaperone DnaJ-domain superfamily protein [Hirschfeldia incana]|nr:Chaperone DnaJ-domain superfamily protein [Hirschfeldia incana]KAJ0249313.1 Chaperone DnaJ-domain superfamily protein [Hirschfeldia incana]
MASKGNDDLYAVLGLKKECTTVELRSAYKKLALRWHPDRCSSTGDSEFVDESKKKFQAIQEAYSVLSDSNKRFLYDVGAYNSDDDDHDQNGMGDFLNEMATMMNQSKPSENNQGDSFEQLQDLFNEMFQGDAAAFSSSSSSSTFTSSSCSFVFDTNAQQSPFQTNSMEMNDPFAFDTRAHHTFSLGVEHQQDFKKGKNNGGRRNRRKSNAQSATHETSSSNNYGVPTS